MLSRPSTRRLPRPWLALVMVLTPLLTAAAQPEPRILVSGEGRAQLTPDLALLSLSVTREADTARQALDDNSAAMAEVLAALRREGIAERDLQTSDFAIQPLYRQQPPAQAGQREAPRIAGYRVSNRLAVRVRDLKRLGAVLDRAVSLGVNEGGQIQFDNDDPAAAIEQARRAAVQEALAKARTLAEAAGVRTGRILQISEQSFTPRPMAMAKSAVMMDMARESVPVAAGENSYQVTVQMEIAIEQ
jgi:uncharacterized protein